MPSGRHRLMVRKFVVNQMVIVFCDFILTINNSTPTSCVQQYDSYLFFTPRIILMFKVIFYYSYAGNGEHGGHRHLALPKGAGVLMCPFIENNS